VAGRADQPVVGREDVVHVAGELDPGTGKHDEVVADPLQVAEQVRGQDDCRFQLGDRLHEVPVVERIGVAQWI
jgi:hypothetical protein